MIRAGLAGLAVLSAAPAWAEGGAIRSGEHDGFSRIVMVIEPTTEWSLETGSGRASVFFPGRALDFGTTNVFEKIPRTRITGVTSRAGETGTSIDVALGCDCRVSASFVGARYLALDVADRDMVPAAAPPATAEAPGASEAPGARDAREASIVASAEEVLLRQIERAADQGLIELSQGPETAEESEAPLGVLTRDAAPPETPSPAPLARPAATEPPTMPVANRPRDAEATLSALLAHEQIEAITVFDRDRPAVDHLTEAAVPRECLPDEMLDVGAWSNGQPLFEQSPTLAARLVGEFDAPDTQTLADLARLNIRFGFGWEAEAQIASFDLDLEERPLLVDLARAVEGRAVTEGGPLSLGLACPGRHGLWLALAGAAPAFHSPGHFSGVQEAFGELPADMRATLAPELTGRLLDAGRAVEARAIFDTAARPGAELSVDMRLVEARLMAAEGREAQAVTMLNSLVETGAHNATEALMHMVRLALDAGLDLPDRSLTDLAAAALQQRGSPLEVDLRELLARALAAKGDLASAIVETRAAMADLPHQRRWSPLAVDLLGTADPGRTGAAAYARTVLTAADLLAPDPRNDAARTAIATHLLALGLPKDASDMIQPAAGRDEAARLVLARAHLRLGRATAARAVLAGLAGPDAADLRARAFASDGDFTAASASLRSKGRIDAARGYAWPSGDWSLAAETPDPAVAAMAAYMGAREGQVPPRPPATDPASLETGDAFVEPLPPLTRPSLEAARRLLATGPGVEDLIGSLLAAPRGQGD